MNFKNVFTTGVILMSYCLFGAENVEVTFSQADVASRLRKIDDSFLASSGEEDNWLLFVPLLEWVNRQRTPEKARASEQEKIISEIFDRFVLYSFACEHDDQKIKAEFAGRRHCVELIAKIVSERSDKEKLYLLADWLSSANVIVVKKSTVDQELKCAMEKDSLAIYGGKPMPRYPGTVGSRPRVGPAWRAVKARVNFRNYYNGNLVEFRRFAFGVFHNAIFDGFKKLTAKDREEIWNEFCQRANVTEEEKMAAEKANPFKEKKNASESDKEAEVSIDL